MLKRVASYLFYNEIGDEGIKQISEGLKANSSVTYINFDDKDDIVNLLYFNIKK